MYQVTLSNCGHLLTLPYVIGDLAPLPLIVDIALNNVLRVNMHEDEVYQPSGCFSSVGRPTNNSNWCILSDVSVLGKCKCAHTIHALDTQTF